MVSWDLERTTQSLPLQQPQGPDPAVCHCPCLPLLLHYQKGSGIDVRGLQLLHCVLVVPCVQDEESLLGFGIMLNAQSMEKC